MKCFLLLPILGFLYCFKPVTNNLPDPDVYLVKLFDCLRKNDTVTYLKLQPTLEDFKFVMLRLEPNQDRKITDEEILAAREKHLAKAMRYFKQVRTNAAQEKINWASVQYINTTYDLEKESPSYVPRLQGEVVFSMDGEEFRLGVDDAACVNGRWTGGILKRLKLPPSRIIQQEYNPTENVEYEELIPEIPDTSAVIPRKD